MSEILSDRRTIYFTFLRLLLWHHKLLCLFKHVWVRGCVSGPVRAGQGRTGLGWVLRCFKKTYKYNAICHVQIKLLEWLQDLRESFIPNNMICSGSQKKGSSFWNQMEEDVCLGKNSTSYMYVYFVKWCKKRYVLFSREHKKPKNKY